MLKVRLVLMLLVMIGWSAASTRMGGRVLGAVRVWMKPKDAWLLGYLPASSPWLVYLQVTRVQPTEDEKARQQWEEMEAKLEETTGVKPSLDVDVVAVGEELLVARGRYDWSQMEPRLKAAGFQPEWIEGRRSAKTKDLYLTVDGDYLLVARKVDALAEALKRHRTGGGMREDTPVVRLAQSMGWDSPVLAAAEVPEMWRKEGLAPVTSVALTLDMADGELALQARLTPRTPREGTRLQETLEKYRKQLLQQAMRHPQFPSLVSMLESASVEVEGQGHLVASMKVPEALLTELKDSKETAAEFLFWSVYVGWLQEAERFRLTRP